MVKFVFSAAAPSASSREALALPFVHQKNRQNLAFAGLSALQKRAVRAAVGGSNFPKQAGIYPVFTRDGTVLVQLMGSPTDKNPPTTRDAREAGLALHQALRAHGVQQLAVLPGSFAPARFAPLARAYREGVALGAYQFTHFLGEKGKQERAKKQPLRRVRFVGAGRAENRQTSALCQGISLAKDLVNTPPSVCTPEYIANAARELAGQFENLSFEEFGEAQLKKMGANGILTVGQGSKRESRMVVLRLNAPAAKNSRKKPLVLVGKGVSYDTGGHSLKPARYMRGMKQDMAGAATMIGAMAVLAAARSRRYVVAVVPTVENAIGPDAYFPDDVITMMNGLTVEVANTDAEGRLILADALTWAERELRPSAMVDAATLTGACDYAVGNDFCAALSNNAGLVQRLKTAAQQADEPLWELPLHARYNKMLKSSVADIINCSDGLKPGTIEGGLFLQKFVENTPWAHLDIASVAFCERTETATGRTVRTLVHLAEGG